ncbi:MAG: SRPBCC family protein [Pseudomonadota bacterium]
MERATELELIDELLGLKAQTSPFLDQNTAQNPVSHYTSQERFDRERSAIFKTLPHAVAHISELKNPGDFIRCEAAGVPILLTRTASGETRAFINACRHRGTRLVDDEKGCKRRFSCPYHAWTYANTGELLAAPHFDSGFPDQDKSELGLVELECAERFGLVWVMPTPESAIDIDTLFAPLAEELTALGMADLSVVADTTETRSANWKILVEGGIEAYHFKVAHRSTIGPYFEDNLSSYRPYGPHMRAVLPRVSLADLDHDTRDSWRLRDHANILYTLFPSTQLLVQQDHVVWIRSNPQGPGTTELRMTTLAPPTDDAEHWQRNHTITTRTLDEDFVIGESMQATASSGANDTMLFGRFEGALATFNTTVNQYLDRETER